MLLKYHRYCVIQFNKKTNFNLEYDYRNIYHGLYNIILWI